MADHRSKDCRSAGDSGRAVPRARTRTGSIEPLERRVLLSMAVDAAVANLRVNAINDTPSVEREIVSIDWKGTQVHARRGQFILRLEAGGTRAAEQVSRIEGRIRRRRPDVRVSRHLGGRGDTVVV